MRSATTSIRRPPRNGSAMTEEPTVLVTGAAGGIGRATAGLYLAEGANVVAADLTDPAEHYDTRRSLCTAAADVTDPAQVQALVAQAVERFGRLDILVCCAAIIVPETWQAIGSASWDKVLAVNTKGSFLCAQAAARQMQAQGGGSIVILSSVAGRRMSVANGAHYTASKYALVGLTRHLAHEFGQGGIRINCVCPGSTATRATLQDYGEEALARIVQGIPLGRLARPEDIAEVIRFVAGEKARHMQGAIVDVNGGQY
ncbi:short-chain dehydrogenase [Paracoccus thiocyanatus]|uniref:Short-chain dehydrogenase n=2 Tax=Paracoccus thiocyanatus TaxID=34006 RepID=A0A3D8PGK0_9RHOB|nr:short-chain dehydrogenase [Paracoccus thiocyanatus]